MITSRIVIPRGRVKRDFQPKLTFNFERQLALPAGYIQGLLDGTEFKQAAYR
jgi:hypothetical protein